MIHIDSFNVDDTIFHCFIPNGVKFNKKAYKLEIDNLFKK